MNSLSHFVQENTLCIRSAVPEQLLISFPARLSANGEYLRCFVGRFTANYGRIFFERLTVSIRDIFFTPASARQGRTWGRVSRAAPRGANL